MGLLVPIPGCRLRCCLSLLIEYRGWHSSMHNGDGCTRGLPKNAAEDMLRKRAAPRDQTSSETFPVPNFGGPILLVDELAISQCD